MIRVSRIHLSAICYATEDILKVEEGINKLVGVLPNGVKPSVSKAKGHYGDEINIITLNLEGQVAEVCARQIFSKMDEKGLKHLLQTIELRFEKSKLFLRFSKFQAYIGRIALEDTGDAIKVIVEFRGYLKGKSYSELLKDTRLVSDIYV